MWTRKNLDFTRLFHKSTSDHKYYMNFYYYNRKKRLQNALAHIHRAYIENFGETCGQGGHPWKKENET